MATRSKLAVILHADVVGSTTLVQMDERVAHERIRDAFQQCSEIISRYGGKTHELRGDALLAEFQRPSDAVTAALAIQSGNARRNEGLSDDIRPVIRIGMAMGEVVIADNTVTGAGVVLAQRLEQLAKPGGVVVQGAIYEALPRRLPFEYENLGEQQLKGFDDAVRAFGIRLDTNQELPAPETDPDDGRVKAPQTDEKDRPSLAVLPFDNQSTDPDQEFLADGLSQDLITALSGLRWLSVVARSNSFEASMQTGNTQSTGEELRVRFVVTGSVRRAGNRVRVTATLSETGNGNQLWTKRYDRVMDDIFDLQDELTAEIAAQLGYELTAQDREQIARTPPKDLSAWAAFQRGISQLNTGEMEQARRSFRRSMELDPGFSSAYSADAYAHFYQAVRPSVRPEDLPTHIEELLQETQEALQLDSQDSVAHIVRGMVHILQSDFETALKKIEEGVSLNPSSVLGIVIRGFVKLIKGDSAEMALADFDLARRLAPGDSLGSRMRISASALANLVLGHYEEAARLGEEGARSGGFWSVIYAIEAHFCLGNHARARELVSSLLAKDPSVTIDFLRQKHLSGIPAYPRDSDVLERHLEVLNRAGIPAS